MAGNGIEEAHASEGKALLHPLDGSFSTVRLSSGEIVSFTRSEARAISYMSRHSNHLLSRGQLLDAITENGSDKNDRSIDFLMNRLRRKLHDDARDPRFIATRYGEGYVWLAEVRATMPDTRDATIIVGPIRESDLVGTARKAGRTFVRQIFLTLRDEAPEAEQVVWAPDLDETERDRTGSQALFIETTLFQDRDTVECIVSSRARGTGMILHASRHVIDADTGRAASLLITARDVAQSILNRDWGKRALDATGELAVPVAVHNATQMPNSGIRAWPKTDARLRALRAEDPDNPELALMSAAHLHAKYVVRGQELFLDGTATCAKDEAEIERLVLGALDFAQAVPNYAVTAGKLLYFVDRRYRDVAVDLAEQGHRANTAAAASLAVIGQFRAFLGDTDSAIDCLHQAVTLSEHGSQQQVYALVLLCQALVAADDRDGLARARRDLYKAVPAGILIFEPLFGDPDAPSLRAKAATMMLSRGRARAVLMNLHYVSARLFVCQSHRENILRGPLALFQRRFGALIVPEKIAAMVPDLIL